MQSYTIGTFRSFSTGHCHYHRNISGLSSSRFFEIMAFKIRIFIRYSHPKLWILVHAGLLTQRAHINRRFNFTVAASDLNWCSVTMWPALKLTYYRSFWAPLRSNRHVSPAKTSWNSPIMEPIRRLEYMVARMLRISFYTFVCVHIWRTKAMLYTWCS